MGIVLSFVRPLVFQEDDRALLAGGGGLSMGLRDVVRVRFGEKVAVRGLGDRLKAELDRLLLSAG